VPSILDRISCLKDKISAAARKAGRDASEITLLAVVKTVPLHQVFEALDAGISVIAENRVQEAKTRVQKIRSKYPYVKIHFIGHLQTNKVKQVLEMFDVIQSVDSFKIANEIDKRADKPVYVFVEVNTSNEKSKFGVEPENIFELVEQISHLTHVRITGLMTIGAFTENSEKIRACFKKLKGLKYQLHQKGYTNIEHLSMGMSYDFELAIEEGSDIIRIGSAIFGERNYQGGM